MSVRLSVIVPVFNGAAYLAEAVGSALENGCEPIEVLVIDDGSTDASGAVARALADRHPDRVRLLQHPGGANRGVSATRNRGLEEARGEWVAFLDADDRYLPGHLAGSASVLEAEPEVGLVYGRIRHIDRDGAPSTEGPREWGNGPGEGRVPEAFRRLLSGNFIPLATAVCRKESVRRAGGFDLGLGSAFEDYLLWTKIAAREDIYYTDRCTSEYRVHAGSYSAGFARRERASAEELEYLRRVWDWIPAEAARGRASLEEAETEIGGRIAYRLYQALRSGDRAQAVREWRCLRSLPHRNTLFRVPGYWRAQRRAGGMSCLA